MQTISIKLMKLEVNSFSPRTRELNLSLVYDDGARARKVTKSTAIDDINQLAADFIGAIRSDQKKVNYVHDDEELFAGHMNIMIKSEGSNTEKLANHLRNLKQKADKIANHNTADGYLRMIDDIKRIEFKF